MTFSIAMSAPPSGNASYAFRMSCSFHRDDVGRRQRIDEEVARDDLNAIGMTGAVDRVLCVNSHRRKIERLKAEMRMPRRDQAR